MRGASGSKAAIRAAIHLLACGDANRTPHLRNEIKYVVLLELRFVEAQEGNRK
jgi:hypothetical protein